MLRKKFFASILLVGTLAMPMLLSSCAARVGYRSYDPYYHDYHRWDDHEHVYYNQWTVETHHEHDKDFRKLNRHDQEEYWKWRHDYHLDHH